MKDRLVSHVDPRVVRFFFAIHKTARGGARTVAGVCDSYQEVVSPKRLGIQIFMYVQRRHRYIHGSGCRYFSRPRSSLVIRCRARPIPTGGLMKRESKAKRG